MHNAWNFKGHIAIKLETMCKTILGEGCTFTADSIECGNFVRAMYAIADKLKLADFEELVLLAGDYLDKPANQINPEDAQRIFDEFCRIVQVNRNKS